MAIIAPTVDTIGDEALVNSIIDKSITEIQDELVSSIRSYAFYNCTALNKAVFGAVSSVADRAFEGCTALTTADFHAATSIGTYAFDGCIALTALILRSETMATLSRTNAFTSTPIASGSGYIYVPAALVDSYKTATNWSTYAAQIRAIEDYPEVCDPYSWVAVSKAIENGTYKDVYKIGDEVPVDLGSEGIINMQVAAFDADTLADGSGTAAISWVAKEALKKSKRMNPVGSGNQEGTGTYGGWEKSEMRTYLRNTVKPMIPQVTANQIVDVKKTQLAYDGSSSSFTQTTEDDLWLISPDECYGSIYHDLLGTNSSRIKGVQGGIDACGWWTRKAASTLSFKGVAPNGAYTDFRAETTYYFVVFGFCTGRTPTA